MIAFFHKINIQEIVLSFDRKNMWACRDFDNSNGYLIVVFKRKEGLRARRKYRIQFFCNEPEGVFIKGRYATTGVSP